MTWNVEYTDEFGGWWGTLTEPYAGTADPVRRAPTSDLICVRSERVAILLIGGDKSGGDRWCERYIPLADRLYDEHLEELRREEMSDG